MELNKTLELLKDFSNANGIQAGAVNLLETMVKNNVAADDAHQFCQEHFMSSSIAEYYIKFYDYIVDTLTKNSAPSPTDNEESPTIIKQTDTSNVAEGIQDINNTLKEIATCLKQLAVTLNQLMS